MHSSKIHKYGPLLKIKYISSLTSNRKLCYFPCTLNIFTLSHFRRQSSTPRAKLQEPITNYQRRGSSLGSQSPIVKHRNSNIEDQAINNTKGWNSYLLWGPTYPFGAQSYWLYCFVLHDNPSEVRVLRLDTNRQLTHTTPSRLRSTYPFWCQGLVLLIV